MGNGLPNASFLYTSGGLFCSRVGHLLRFPCEVWKGCVVAFSPELRKLRSHRCYGTVRGRPIWLHSHNIFPLSWGKADFAVGALYPSWSLTRCNEWIHCSVPVTLLPWCTMVFCVHLSCADTAYHTESNTCCLSLEPNLTSLVTGNLYCLSWTHLWKTGCEGFFCQFQVQEIIWCIQFGY